MGSTSLDLGLVFIGLEFGLMRKRGGIATIDIRNGKKVWDFYEMPCYTHSSPLYIQKHKQVVIGSNDGCAFFYAKSGKLLWKCPTGDATEKELDSGFSRFYIKESFAYDPKRDCILFGNRDGVFLSVAREFGRIISSFKADFGFYSTPVIYKDTVLITSLDKHLYCLGLDTLKEQWRWNAGARIFATPTIVENSVFIGANTGRLTELDPETGDEISFCAFTERIQLKPASTAVWVRVNAPWVEGPSAPARRRVAEAKRPAMAKTH